MNIYFSGIGGVGIGPLAEIAHDAGHNITGSDKNESLVTNELEKKGIIVNLSQDGKYLSDFHKNNPIDLFIYTSALPVDHPELVLAKNLGIKTAKRDELLAQIIKEKNLKLIAVAGTHGKTTTTGMMIWALKQLNIPISYSIGTTINFGPSGSFDKTSEYFIYECDEFDRNFLNFTPYLSIISSLDYDHPDTYPTEESYLEAFRQFAKKSDQVITWSDQRSEIFKDLPNVDFLDTSQINSNIKLAGNHNRRNATLVQKAIEKLGISQNTDSVLSNFPGTDRRFEKLAENIYSDYGHHPVEIAATLQLARELSSHVILIYQPHQNVRQHEIKDQYTNQFDLAEEVYWLPTYLSRENPNLPILKPEDLIKNITNKNIHVTEFSDDLWNIIKDYQKNNKLVLFMGAGTIDNWLRQKIAESK